MDEQKIKELIKHMKEGKQSAFEEIYRETYRSVYFICLGFMKNEENAKDAMQDTYMTAFSKLEQLKEEEKFVAWLKQIAVNRCKRLLEQKNAEPMEEEILENLKKEENENFLPEEYITNKAKRKIVMDIMRKKLSDIQYQTVILFYFNGLEIEEIADMMECPPGTVKSRLSVARNKIKEGVLEYEKESKDKLYSFVGIPFLTSLLAMEASAMDVPDIWGSLVSSLNITNIKGDAEMNNKVKAGSGIAMSKVIIGAIVAIILIGAGIGIAVGISKGNGDNENQNGNDVVIGSENSGGESGDTTSGENDSTDPADMQGSIELHPAFDKQIRWMTSHNFSVGQLESAPEGAVLFPNSSKPMALPISSQEFSVPEDKCGEMIQPGKSMNIRVDEFEHFILNVRNMSEVEMTVDECLTNGWIMITSDGYGDIYGDEYFAEMFGYPVELSDTNEYMEMMLETYGSPTFVDIMMTDDSFMEGLDNAIENGDTNIYIGASVQKYLESAAVYEAGKTETIHLGWEFEEYAILITIHDSSRKTDDGVITPHLNGALAFEYYPIEVWEYVLAGDYMYNENEIDRLYPEGMLLPEKEN